MDVATLSHSCCSLQFCPSSKLRHPICTIQTAPSKIHLSNFTMETLSSKLHYTNFTIHTSPYILYHSIFTIQSFPPKLQLHNASHNGHLQHPCTVLVNDAGAPVYFPTHKYHFNFVFCVDFIIIHVYFFYILHL